MILKQYGLFRVADSPFLVATKTVPAGATLYFCEGCENVGIKSAGFTGVLEDVGKPVRFKTAHPASVNITKGVYFYTLGNNNVFEINQVGAAIGQSSENTCNIVLSGQLKRSEDVLKAGSIVIGRINEYEQSKDCILLCLQKI